MLKKTQKPILRFSKIIDISNEGRARPEVREGF